MSPGAKRLLRWTAAAVGVVAVILTVATAVLLRPSRLKPRIEAVLSQRLNLVTTVGSLSWSMAPRPRLSGTHLELRIPGRPDLPPFVSVDGFWMDVGPWSALRGRVETVHLVGLKVVVPPGDARRSLPDANAGGSSKIVVNRLEAPESQLTILRRKPGDPPFVFQIHSLVVDDLGLDRRMNFVASLTNPVPEGLIDTQGAIGPWPRQDPTSLPIEGRYRLSHAKLATINGIQGELTSAGQYSGRLTEITVTGQADTPDFNLELGGKPVPLHATFTAVVDASDGSTRIDDVDATLLNTPLRAEGMVANLPGPGNHAIDLRVTVREGRIEDLLTLAIDSPKPPLTGEVALRTTVSIPPGRESMRDRIRLAGEFGLEATRFNDAEVQRKLTELSRRSQGKDQDELMGRVMTSLTGSFELARGVLMLRRLSFHVPGAKVDLNGTYALASGALDLKGTLTMQASVSQAVGGFKSIFLKPFDPLFKKNGAGAVVPITITGTREHPEFGLNVKKAVGRK
jgi:hypothetical protein